MQNKELYGAMRYLGQFAVILTVSCAGEVIKRAAGLPIPGSIYGLVLMFLLLVSGAIDLEQVKEAGEFLVEIMPLMFIPPAAGLLDSWGLLEEMLLSAAVLIPVSSCLVIFVSGRVTQFILRRTEKDGG